MAGSNFQGNSFQSVGQGPNGGRQTVAVGPGLPGGISVTTTPSSTYKPPPPTPKAATTAPAAQPDKWANWTGMPQGWGEDWYQQNAYQWDQPTQTGQYWNGVQGQFNGPQQGETSLYGYANSLNGPNALDNTWDQLKGGYNQPGAAENFYGAQGNSLMGGSQAGDYYGSTRNQFQQGGAMESAFGDLYSRATQQGALAQNAGAVTQDINAAHGTDQWLQANQRSLNGPGYTERAAQNYSPVQGYSEGLMQSGAGLDDLYSRQFDVGSRRLDNAAAARGGFNSGAALRSQEELNRDLSADQIKQTISLADQADKYRMDERQFGLATDQGADSAMMSRLGLGLQGSGQADTTALNRATATQSLYGKIEDQRQSGLQLAEGAARDTQGAALARLMGGASVADMASKDQINRFDSTSAAANQAQTAGLNRTNSALNNANNVGQLRISTANAQGGLAQGAQSLAMQRLLNGGNLAGQADNQNQQRLTGAQTAANSAQNMRQNRLRGNLQDAQGLGTAQANTYLQGMEPARAAQFQASLAEIQGMLQKGQIDPAAADAQTQELFSTVGLGVQAYTAYKSNPSSFLGSGAGAPPGMPAIPTMSSGSMSV